MDTLGFCIHLGEEVKRMEGRI